MGDWSFLTNHARAIVLIARQPNVRLRDLADALDVTERTAYGIVVDLTEAGYVVKERDGRRNRYEIQPQLPLRETITRERTIGGLLDVLMDTKAFPASDGSGAKAPKIAGRLAKQPTKPPTKSSRKAIAKAK